MDTGPVSQRSIGQYFFEFPGRLPGHSFLCPGDSESESRCCMLRMPVQNGCECGFGIRNRRAPQAKKTEPDSGFSMVRILIEDRPKQFLRLRRARCIDQGNRSLE